MDDKKTVLLPDKTREEKTVAKERDVTPPAADKATPQRKPRVYETQDQTSTYEEYLFGRGTFSEGSKNQAWSDTTKGRVMIRLFSRGIVGSAAFALGGRYANKHLKDYEHYDWNPNEPLHWVAKGFDTVIGKPISWAARTIGGAEKGEEYVNSATRFRTKAYFFDKKIGHYAGRSLGAEMVQVSFDFACASMGDASTRNIIQAFDPNVQKPWIVDGKFDADKWMESVGRATWRVLTKNAGEDWGAALPYVYQMKWQRQAISKLFPGSKLMLDYGWNGGSLKVDHMGKVNGDYQLAGALDLQGRFVGYNWYTLMYRDGYDAISRNVKKWHDHGFQLDAKLPDNPIESVLGGVGNTIRYVAKSFVKANLYMQPAVPFFWAFRTPQTKWRASPVSPDHPSGYGIVNTQMMDPTRVGSNGGYVPATKRTWDSNASRAFQGGTFTKQLKEGEKGFFGFTEIKADNYDPYAWKNQKTIFGAILNPFGWISYKTGSAMVKLTENISNDGWLNKWVLGDRHGLQDQKVYREMTMRSFTDAAFSYTPYMIAKAEMGLRVDDRPAGGGLGEMDKAIYGAIDSLGTLRFNDFGHYVERIGHLMSDTTHMEVASREGQQVKKEKIGGDGSVIPHMSPDPATRIEKSSVVEHHKEALAHKPKEDAQTWKSYIADKREAAQLHPTHPTVQ